MADIGPMTAKLVASAEGVQRGVDLAKKTLDGGATMMAKSAEKAAKGWTSSLAAGLRGAPGLIKSSLAGITSALDSSLADPLNAVTTVLERIPVVGGLLALPIEGVAHIIGRFESEMQNVLKLGRLADNLRMDIQEFNYLQTALDFAGVIAPAETLEKVLFKFQANLGAVAVTARTAGGAFREMADGMTLVPTETDAASLALKRLKISAEEITHMPLQEAFVLASQSLARMENPALVAKTAMDLFGKSAKDLFPLFQRIEMIQKARGAVDFFGSGVSHADYAAVRKVQEAKKMIEQFRAGLNSQILSAVAPIMATLGERMNGLGITWNGLTDKIIAGVDLIGTQFSRLLDMFAEGGIWGMIKAGWSALVSAITVGSVDLGKGIGKGIVQGIREGIVSSIGVIGPKGLAMLMPSHLGKLLTDFLASGEPVDVAAMQEKADAAARLLDESWGTLKKIWAGGFAGGFEEGWQGFMTKVKTQMGVTYDEAARKNPFALWAESLDRVAKLQQSLLGPLDHFVAKMTDVLDLQTRAEAWLANGRVVRPLEDPFGRLGAWNKLLQGPVDQLVAPETLARGAFQAMQGLRQAFGGSNYQPTGVMLAGSREAYSTIQAHRFTMRDTIQEQIRRLLEEATRQQTIEVEVGREILREMQKEPRIGVRDI